MAILELLIRHESFFDNLPQKKKESTEMDPGTSHVASQLSRFPSSDQEDDPFKDFILQKRKEKKEAEESAIIIAARNGITEMVKSILEASPIAINDRDRNQKNIATLAGENRHVNLFDFFKHKKILKENVVLQTDKDGNTVLHATAVYPEKDAKLWPFPGDASQMQWEMKWFQYVKSCMPPGINIPPNSDGKDPEEIFRNSHMSLAEKGQNWMIKTSESCTVVAALIAGVAFATTSSTPGGEDEKTGRPKLESEVAFQVFSISSLVALCLSVTSLTMFLSILTSRFQQKDFAFNLPFKLLLGMSSLFMAIASMLISFSSAHSLMATLKFKFAVFPVYMVAGLPITIFAAAQLPLYLDLLRSSFGSWSIFSLKFPNPYKSLTSFCTKCFRGKDQHDGKKENNTMQDGFDENYQDKPSPSKQPSSQDELA